MLLFGNVTIDSDLTLFGTIFLGGAKIKWKLLNINLLYIFLDDLLLAKILKVHICWILLSHEATGDDL